MNLLPIETAPKDGTWILLFGPSGYTTTPLRCEVSHWDPEYRPLSPWQTHSSDAFADGGNEPTHWCPIPSLTQDVVLPEKTVADEPVKDDAEFVCCPGCGEKIFLILGEVTSHKCEFLKSLMTKR